MLLQIVVLVFILMYLNTSDCLLEGGGFLVGFFVVVFLFLTASYFRYLFPKLVMYSWCYF